VSIFQKSVINKYLKNLDKAKLDKAFGSYKTTFTGEKIAIIRTVKEEEYQDGFLRDLFVNVLGYKLNIDSKEHDLVREKKNQTDAKKADGAVIRDGKVTAVIELKDTKTKDMGSVTEQAFGYKNSQEGCKYVITSNFHKLRFYIDNKVDFEEFDLFELGRDDFELLYLLLNRDSIFNDIPAKLKEETKFHEETVSGKLYSDYSSFKKNLFGDMTKNNPQYDKLTLFKKSQKLIDRYLFILFSEDRGLLPPNSISRMITRFDVLKSEDSYKPLYEICRQYFGYMNTGNHKENIPAYNGGLFLPDEILDSIKIDDGILRDHLWKLSTYDYATEIDVNILGHIFEHSLSEIEEITATIEGVKTDKAKSKRKKDGVYYTPKYITQYIVENTVGTLCREKRRELGIEQIEFDDTYRKANGFLTEKGKILFDKLETYKKWLITLKIVDPACGSGAFLNQALNFLIAEHKTIDDIIAELTASPLRLFDTDKAILENNLYGVDINDESVEIAKLSLWLHTARKDRKLSDLNNNIKCGNSLINDPKVAGDKAFDWHKEFPDIMQAGGFDVVIGNPPYGAIQDDNCKSFYEMNYTTTEGRFDLYELFIEKSFSIAKNEHFITYIIPNTILTNLYSKKLRTFITDNYSVTEISNFGIDVFHDPTIHTCIFSIRLAKNLSTKVRKQINDISDLEKDFDYITTQNVLSNNHNKTFDIFISPNESNLFNRLKKEYKQLQEVCFIRQCIKTGNDDIYVKHSEINPGDPWKPSLSGKLIGRYLTKGFNLYIKYGDWLARNWKNKSFYESPKIVIRETGERIVATIDMENRYLLSSLYSIYPKKNYEVSYIKFLLAILNSNFATYFIHKIAFGVTKGAFTKVRTNQLGRLPIKDIQDVEQLPFISKSEAMLDLNAQLQDKANKFQSRIKSNFAIAEISTKLQSFHEHDFKTFVAELKKQKVSPTLKQQDEWEEYFNSYKKEINDLQAEIKKTDAEIDQMVYKLYELTDEEIRIVEGSVM